MKAEYDRTNGILYIKVVENPVLVKTKEIVKDSLYEDWTDVLWPEISQLAGIEILGIDLEEI